MTPTIQRSSEGNEGKQRLLLTNIAEDLEKYGLTSSQVEHINNVEGQGEVRTILRYDHDSFLEVIVIDKKKEKNELLEELRRAGHKVLGHLKESGIKEVTLLGRTGDPSHTFALLEGIGMSSYQFLNYKNDRDNIALKLSGVNVDDPSFSEAHLNELNILLEGNRLTRNLVNEPLSTLTAAQFGKEVEKAASESGFKAEILDLPRIRSLKMGGLLAVNKGSVDPPTFSIMEWKPENSVNSKPIVLVGKGIVYDTGGLSLKGTANSMDKMKSDMGGAGAVLGTIHSIARQELPLHIVGLVPATDNRPGGNAYVPGDVVTMHDGTTVEIMNTDAEGRLVMADALTYSKRYDPELVIDLATLTGSSVMTLGHAGATLMGTAPDEEFERMIGSGYRTHERVVRLPLWKDFNDNLRSDIADMKNVGGKYAGAITAGKFLQHFTDAPWMHLDIAGPSFMDSSDNYRGKGGTGFGVRLLNDFFKSRI